MSERNGLAIGFLTDGKLDVNWASKLYQEIPRGIPSGLFWRVIWVEGQDYKDKGGYAKARNELVKKARELNVKWLFMVDTDIFLPPDVITKLMSNQKEVCTGIYYSKSLPPQPILYKNLGNGPYWDFPVDEVFEIEASGAGSCLIDMDVFDKFDEAGIPYFKENWEYEKQDGSITKVEIGEDYWFFVNCNKLGIKTYADSSCLCDHVDYNTWTIYPGEEEVEKINKKKEEKYAKDEEKKNIVFYNPVPIPFDGNEISKRPVGGAETCVINLAKNLTKYYNVYVINHCETPGVYDGVNYINMDDWRDIKDIDIDTIIVLRHPPVVDFNEILKPKKVYLWAHDFAECPVWDNLGYNQDKFSKLICLSNWHKKNVLKRFPWFEQERIEIKGNGYDPSLFFSNNSSNNDKKKLVYSSTPFRGLDVLLEIFPDIKKEVPEAELHICSSMEVYLSSDKDYQHLYEMAKNMEGVVYHGSVNQKHLGDIMRDSYLYVYSSIYEETYCISTLEAIASGIPVVTTPLGALPETIVGGTAEFAELDNFKDKVIEILKDENKYQKLKGNISCCEDIILSKTWSNRAKEWMEMIESDN